MSTVFKPRRGTTVQHSTFTGAAGEMTLDTTKNTIVVHDGATAGGFPLAKEGGTGAPSNAEYIVATADAGLSAERVLTDTNSVAWDKATAGQVKANVQFGATGTTACVGNDSRLSDARTPTAHTQAVSTITFSATDKLAGRSSAGAGAGEEITCTSYGRSLLDNTALWWDKVNSRLGIGTNLPDDAIHVLRTGSRAVIFLQASGTNGYAGLKMGSIDQSSEYMLMAGRVNNADASGLVIRDTDAGADRMVINDTTGKVNFPAGAQSAGTDVSVIGHTHSTSDVQFAATNKLLGRSTAGAGSGEEITCTAAGRALLDDNDAATQRTTLGLAALATKATVGTTDIDAAAVTYARIQNVSATDKVLGRSTAGAGSVEEIACTAAGRALIDDASASDQRTTLGLGTAATQSVEAIRQIPQNSQSGAYVVVAGDAGKHIYISTGGVTFNASVLAVGDAVTIVNNSNANQTITAGASVTFRLAGTATTGNRTLAQYGICTFLCVVGGATPTFICSGAGLS
jgi:hypothetical protein